MATHLQNVAIIGAGGRIGCAITESLIKTGKHTITDLTRKGSTTPQVDGIKVIEVDYDDNDAIITALRGQQFLIIALSVTAPPLLHGLCNEVLHLPREDLDEATKRVVESIRLG